MKKNVDVVLDVKEDLSNLILMFIVSTNEKPFLPEDFAQFLIDNGVTIVI